MTQQNNPFLAPPRSQDPGAGPSLSSHSRPTHTPISASASAPASEVSRALDTTADTLHQLSAYVAQLEAERQEMVDDREQMEDEREKMDHQRQDMDQDREKKDEEVKKLREEVKRLKRQLAECVMSIYISFSVW